MTNACYGMPPNGLWLIFSVHGPSRIICVMLFSIYSFIHSLCLTSSRLYCRWVLLHCRLPSHPLQWVWAEGWIAVLLRAEGAGNSPQRKGGGHRGVWARCVLLDRLHLCSNKKNRAQVRIRNYSDDYPQEMSHFWFTAFPPLSLVLTL